jgi:acyl-CoA reductase-like NAD-dependent aldehyde dehydrogenase
MEVMMEETFGPVVGIMKVESDEEALSLMNDSPYGLVRAVSFLLSYWLARGSWQTASIWTDPTSQSSIAAFNHLVDELECGTVYMNRADALEPSLPWSGWKDSGRGISLSTLGYDQVTRTKAVMMRLKL